MHMVSFNFKFEIASKFICSTADSFLIRNVFSLKLVGICLFLGVVRRNCIFPPAESWQAFCDSLEVFLVFRLSLLL